MSSFSSTSATASSLNSYSNSTTKVQTYPTESSQSFWSKFDAQKLKQYGKWGLVTHLTLSWTILGITYLIVRRSGQGQKIINFLKLQNRVPKQAGAFVIATIIYKAIMPVRIALSLMAIPIVVNKFHLDVSMPSQEPNKQQLLAQGGIVDTVQKIIQ